MWHGEDLNWVEFDDDDYQEVFDKSSTWKEYVCEHGDNDNDYYHEDCEEDWGSRFHCQFRNQDTCDRIGFEF